MAQARSHFVARHVFALFFESYVSWPRTKKLKRKTDGKKMGGRKMVESQASRHFIFRIRDEHAALAVLDHQRGSGENGVINSVFSIQAAK